jgi:S-adenosylmethionine:tRNA ribosyltransferase-isomerase
MNLFFDYELPDHLIAQTPASQRDTARLLVVDRMTQSIRHHTFRDLPQLLAPGDRLILNDTRVVPARLMGRRSATKGRWEGLFIREASPGIWELLAQTRGFVFPGEWIDIVPGPLRLELIGRTDDRHWLVRPNLVGTPEELLNVFGQIPLPPYIRKGVATTDDRERYQTVYATRPGSVAAPTAGLHFTQELLAELEARQITRSSVTLHVGLGTFAPVKAQEPTEHMIHQEWCEVTEQTISQIKATRMSGKRIVAVGTTTVRTLESAARSGVLQPFRGDTELFIFPPFEFQVVDAMITNFHLPRTTLLLLVQALAGTELTRRAYEEAIRAEYRFFSYGDGMLIL